VAHCQEAIRQSDRSSWDVADDYLELSRRGWTQQRIADEFGVSRSSVSKFMACARKCSLANTRPSFWEAYQQVDGKTSAPHAPSESPNAGGRQSEPSSPEDAAMAVQEAVKAEAEDRDRREAERQDRCERMAPEGVPVVAAGTRWLGPIRGNRYEGVALDPDRRKVSWEIAEHPQEPGFWVWAFVHVQNGERWVDYQARGRYLDGQYEVERVFAHHGVALQSIDMLPVEKGFRPLALLLDDLDRQEGKGRHSWVKRQAG
jgi:hypothetical protein